MSDTEYLEWVAKHLSHILQVGTPTEPVRIEWFDDDGFSHSTIGDKGSSWLDGLKSAIDKAME